MVDLHPRTALLLLSESHSRSFSARAMSERTAVLLASSDYEGMPVRERGEDDEVSRFIHTALRSNPGLKYTRALREYRDSGRACEQKRFKNLFSKVVARHGR
jgi:hypothetical protein